MTGPHGLPYVGALDAVRRIETALTQRDAAREASDLELDTARAEADRLLSAARAAGTRTGQERRDAMLAQAQADAEVIRSGGDADARQLGLRVSAERDRVAADFTAFLLVEEP
jgi:vacuolar-type H+-ATPase subunit H